GQQDGSWVSVPQAHTSQRQKPIKNSCATKPSKNGNANRQAKNAPANIYKPRRQRSHHASSRPPSHAADLSSRRSENDGTISAASKLTSHPSGFRSQHVSDPRLERGGWPVHAPYRSGHAIGDSALPAARGRRSANASAQPKKTKRDSAKRGLAKTAS